MILGLGIDIVEIDRIERAASRHGGRFLRRIFTEAEREFADSTARPAEHLAARFAAKEAAAKALGTGVAGGVRFREMEVVREGSGKPSMRLSGRAAERARELGATRVHVSLTHTRSHAAAVVVLEGERARA